jgi:glucose-1-phosphate thymidylyltransferase
MKAIIPVAGAGTRLRPHTYTQPKPLIPVAGKPIIAHLIDNLQSTGIQDFVFIIGYLGDKIKDYLLSEYGNKINMQFVVQEQRDGLGHAIWTAKDTFENEEDILIVVGDIIFDANLATLLACSCSMIGVQTVDNPWDFGVVEIPEDSDYIKKMVEKPRMPKSNLAITGIYKLNFIPLLLETLQYNIENNIRTNGEIQLTDALDAMIKKGSKFKIFPIETWFDCGRKEILLKTNEVLLEKQPYQETPLFENTILIHPVSIGKDCSISNTIIGPYVSIGNGAKIESSIIKNSIIGNYAQLDEVVLHQSIIGSDTLVRGLRQSLNLGDDTEIDFR